MSKTQDYKAKYERLASLVEKRGFVIVEEHGLEVRLVDDDLAARRNERNRLIKACKMALRHLGTTDLAKEEMVRTAIIEATKASQP
jgi:hypothetical protein